MYSLLNVIGKGWRLEFIGKLPELPGFISIAPVSSLSATGEMEIWIFDQKTSAMKLIASDEPIEPLFFEAVTYDIHFERDDAATHLSLPPSAELRRSRLGSEHHSLNFGNNVGFADFLVKTANGTGKLRIEVFSRKADYRTDYLTMREEISAILRNLAMAANARTYAFAAPAKDHYPTLTEWFALLQSHFNEFIKLANAIANNPYSGLSRKVTSVTTERARRVNRQSIGRALRRENGGATVKNLGIALPRKIDEITSSATFDNPENRYYKTLLALTYRNMRALSKVNESGDEDANRFSERKFFDLIRPILKKMLRQLESVMRAPFLENVADSALVRPKSMVFHKHPLYSRFDKLCRLLNGGLSFAGDIVPIGMKETALLYEYWCFLKIVTLLRNRFDLTEQSVVKVNRLRTTVTLSKGKSSAMRFVHKQTGKSLYVVYNRLFNRLPTIAQKPDNVIQFASESRFYIFDAKYRIQFDRDYTTQYGGPGPTTEDINTMHRYRDAIAIPHPMRPAEYLQGIVAGAIVLFPYPHEAIYRTHRFYKSIAQVEIGGLPFLPNATTLVGEKIDALLAAEYPDSASETHRISTVGLGDTD